MTAAITHPQSNKHFTDKGSYTHSRIQTLQKALLLNIAIIGVIASSFLYQKMNWTRMPFHQFLTSGVFGLFLGTMMRRTESPPRNGWKYSSTNNLIKKNHYLKSDLFISVWKMLMMYSFKEAYILSVNYAYFVLLWSTRQTLVHGFHRISDWGYC